MMKKKNSYLNIQILIFCLIIFQSIGIRFFNGQGSFISFVIIILSFNNFKMMIIKDVRFLFVSLLFLLTSKVINPSFTFSSLLYQISLIISTYLFLVGYRNKGDAFRYDFFHALQIFVYHAVIGYCLCVILPNSFVRFNIMNKSFYDLFYVSNSNFGSFQRNTGIFWEPGAFQLVANLYLFYCIKFNKSIAKVLLAIVAVVSSLSTSGLIILLVNVTYFVYNKWKEGKIKLINFFLVLSLTIAFVPIISDNTKDKVSEENTSGIVRLRDYFIGIDLIKEKPIFGHGVFDSTYLLSKSYVKNWESTLFSDEYLEISGDMGGGYTNGFLGLIAWYGIPVSFVIFLFYFKNRFVDSDIIERFLFSLIPLVTLLTEPISYTSIFLMFPFSYWILNKKVLVKNTLKFNQYNNSFSKK